MMRLSNCPTILIIVILFSCKSNDGKLTPEVMPITESVYASVTIQPDSLYQAYAEVSGVIEQVYVEEGDVVTPGSPLIKIRNEAPELNLSNARLALEQAKDDLYGETNALADLESQIHTMELQVNDDSINYERQKRLWEKNIGSKTEFERRRLAYELSVNQLRNLRTSFRRTKQDLQIRYQQALNNYEVARVNTGDYTVRSRLNGKVYSLEKERGEKVSLQEPVATLGSSVDFVIDMLIDERDIARIREDQRVLITLEAYDDRVFIARVSKIYPQKNERTQTFRVEARFTEPLEGALYPGLSGEANIIINKKDKALTIPVNYLNGSRVLTDSGEQEVVIGLKSMDRVEILSGIDSSTTIYLPQ